MKVITNVQSIYGCKGLNVVHVFRQLYSIKEDLLLV